MKTYIGTKIVKADPMVLDKTGEPGYKVVYEDGYVSPGARRKHLNVLTGKYRKVNTNC